MSISRKEEFAEFILNMRTAAGLSRRGLADLIGVQESEILSYEKERKRPTESLIKLIQKTVQKEIQLKRVCKRKTWIILAR